MFQSINLKIFCFALKRLKRAKPQLLLENDLASSRGSDKNIKSGLHYCKKKKRKKNDIHDDE